MISGDTSLLSLHEPNSPDQERVMDSLDMLQQTPTQVNIKSTHHLISNLKKENFDLKMKVHFFEQELKSMNEERGRRESMRMSRMDPDASFAALLQPDNEDEEENAGFSERIRQGRQVSVDQDLLPVQELHDNQIKSIQEQHEQEVENLKNEFLGIAQQACQDIQELHDRIAAQQETIQTLEGERDYYSRQCVILEGARQLENNHEAEIERKEMEIQTNGSRMVDHHVQTQLPPTHDESIQTLSTSIISRNISCQTDPQHQNHHLLLPNPQPHYSRQGSQGQLEEYERNKQRFIDELKERNTLLIRIIQNLDSKLGTGHVGQLTGPVTSFSVIKKAILEKIRSLVGIHQEKLKLEATVAELEQHIEQNKMLDLDQINALHEKVVSYKSQIIQERNETAQKLAQALLSQKQMEKELEDTRKKLETVQSQQFQHDKQMGMMQMGDADRYQRQYIDALAAVENYTTLAAKYDRKIKLARMHLEKYQIQRNDQFHWMEALRVLSDA